MSARNSRLFLVVGGIVAAVALFLVLRPGDEEAGGTTAAAAETTAPADTTTEDAVTTEATTTEPSAPATTAETAQRSFAVAIRDGTVTGGIQRWAVSQGERVRIVVRSDVADSVHLHGYDIEKPVAPGEPAILAFDARLAGRFELEAHHGGGQIAQLDVQP